MLFYDDIIDVVLMSPMHMAWLAGGFLNDIFSYKNPM